MGDSVDFLIDLSSPTVSGQRTSMLPSVSVHSMKNPETQALIAAPADNNPFDFFVHQTETNEADKYDPFEIAFENACGWKEKKKAPDMVVKTAVEAPEDNPRLKKVVPEVSRIAASPVEEGSKKSTAETFVVDETNLDDIQPPDSYLNLSLDLSETSGNITISDTLHLSDMSDIRLSPMGSKDIALSGKPHIAKNTHTKDFVPSQEISDGSLQESPIKALCDFNSEESVKALIEDRIQKCIAKALNDSHQQLRNVSLLDNSTANVLQTSFRPSRASLRTSISVPQNLHLLQDAGEVQEKNSVGNSLLAFDGGVNFMEDLQIPFLDHCLSNKTSKKVPERQSFQTGNLISNSLENIRLGSDSAPARPDSNIFDLPDVVTREVHQSLVVGNSPRRSFHKTHGPETRHHRRSLSCDVLVPILQVSKMTSPPKLPPLPLSSETIRDLSLCSRHSPPKVQEQSHAPGDVSAKLNRPVPLPVCAQPKLVLRKKQSMATNGNGLDSCSGSSARPGRGPMKATLPVQNMTRYTGSPRPSVQPSSRKTTATPRRQSQIDSPAFQKAKLCPLAASTPSTVEAPSDGASTRSVTQQPRRIISSGIPSPSRKGMKMPGTSQFLVKSSSLVPKNVLQAGSKLDTPTKGTSPTLQRRGPVGNPRVLVDRNNGFSSPAVTPVRKMEPHSLQKLQLGCKMTTNRLSGMGKENLAHLR